MYRSELKVLPVYKMAKGRGVIYVSGCSAMNVSVYIGCHHGSLVLALNIIAKPDRVKKKQQNRIRGIIFELKCHQNELHVGCIYMYMYMY